MISKIFVKIWTLNDFSLEIQYYYNYYITVWTTYDEPCFKFLNIIGKLRLYNLYKTKKIKTWEFNSYK